MEERIPVRAGAGGLDIDDDIGFLGRQGVSH
jgi:hypothetical protein